MTEPVVRNIKVLAIYPNGDTILAGADDDPINWRYLVAGDVGVVEITYDAVALVNADGRAKSLPENRNGTELVHRLNPLGLNSGAVMYGPVVIVGSINPATGSRDGEFYDCPSRVSDLFKNPKAA